MLIFQLRSSFLEATAKFLPAICAITQPHSVQPLDCALMKDQQMNCLQGALHASELD